MDGHGAWHGEDGKALFGRRRGGVYGRAGGEEDEEEEEEGGASVLDGPTKWRDGFYCGCTSGQAAAYRHYGAQGATREEIRHALTTVLAASASPQRDIPGH